MNKYQLGAIYGALVGDACGSVLEFYNGRITDKVITNAMHMRGGGVLNVGPGQVTDDGELTMALISILRNVKSTDPYPIDAVALAYSNWHNSHPFDEGQTCFRAFNFIGNYNTDLPSEKMMINSEKYNMFSQSNGALMRATPIAVYYYDQDYDTIAAHARLDAKLSHPNEVCQDVNAVYCVTIAYLINHPGDYKGAIKLAESMQVCDIVTEWLQESKKDIDEYKCNIHIGHLKHAFILAFAFLRTNISYKEAIYKTLSKGSDSDTNAAICGGLVGALHGIYNIPKYMLDPVKNYKFSVTSLIGYKRPDIYKVRKLRL
jgi:ADP-ribosylglycohydrolase